MSQAGAPAAGSPVNAAASPNGQGTGSPDLSQQQIDPAEFQRVRAENQRLQERIRGIEPYMTTAHKAGFKDPALIEKYGAFHKQATESGVQLEQLMGIFNRKVEQSGEDPGTMTKADIEAMIGERLSKQQADFIRSQAEKERDAGFAADANGYSPAEIKKILGEDVDDKQALGYAAMAEAMYYRNLNPYGDDHPLKGSMGPGGKTALEKSYAFLKDFRESLKAAQLKDIGAAARKSQPQNTPTGNAAGQGKPETNAGSGGASAKREKLEAVAAQVMARRHPRQ